MVRRRAGGRGGRRGRLGAAGGRDPARPSPRISFVHFSDYPSH